MLKKEIINSAKMISFFICALLCHNPSLNQNLRVLKK